MIPRYSRKKMAEVWSEENRFRKWLDVELAVCEVQHEKGLIKKKSYDKIFEKADFTLEDILKNEEKNHHEVIAFLNVLQKNIGKESRYIHYGLTSNDVIDTAMSLQILEAIDLLEKEIEKMMVSIQRIAEKHKYTPQIGRTHGIHAEPTTFGLKLAVYYSEFKRHRERLAAAKERIRVGKISGAVGNYAQIEPDIEKEALDKLGLKPTEACTQVIQRDRHAEIVFVAALIAATMEKIATEIRNLQRTEVDEVSEPFATKQKGSSAMPHKKNPVKSENICGLARIIRASLTPALENITLWHERDISHSSAERIIFPDIFIGLDFAIHRLYTIIDGLKVNKKKMLENINLTHGLVFSQRLMLRLINAGMEREEAHTMIQGKVMTTHKKGIDFRESIIQDGEIRKFLTLEEIEALFDLDIYIKHVDLIFERVFG